MQADQALNVFLWLLAFVLVGIFYVAVLLIADRAGKMVKLWAEVRDHLAAIHSALAPPK